MPPFADGRDNTRVNTLPNFGRSTNRGVRTLLALFGILWLTVSAGAQTVQNGWPTYGGDAGGQRYSSEIQINRKSVSRLHVAWIYHTHALDSKRNGVMSAMFETTPVLFEGLLYFTTQFNEIIALDPSIGVEQWKYQPELRELHEGEMITSRGVATWIGGDRAKVCSRRIFEGTNDAQLVAVDAETGLPCKDFGQNGKVDLRLGLKGRDRDFHVTSAPTVVGNIVVLGSSITDNALVNQAKGTVRAFDVMTGKPVWTWEPIAWGEKWAEHTGAANSWSTISADPGLGLLFVPTGSASPDYFGGLRPGDDRDADSVVAIDAATGKKVWAFQVVHHDLWDYDVASEPLLFTWRGQTPALAITTKMGMVFVLDRRTGEPLFPVEERPVPKSDVAGEFASATQPFSAVQSLSPLTLPSKDANERTPSKPDYCGQQMSKLRYDGIYTPPSLEGSLIFPGNIGGVNWGSAAYDPQSGILYANTNRLPYAVQLIPQDGLLVETIKAIFEFRVRFLFALTLLGSLTLLFWKPSRNRWTFGGLFLLAIFTTTAWYQTHSRQSARNSLSAAFGDDYSLQKGGALSAASLSNPGPRRGTMHSRIIWNNFSVKFADGESCVGKAAWIGCAWGS